MHGGSIAAVGRYLQDGPYGKARYMTDAEHGARTVRAIRSALAHVPFYVKQGVAAPAEDAPLEVALSSLPLLTREKIRPTLPKAWLPDGRDAKEELASGRLVVLETGTGDARVRILLDGAWWRAQERRALASNAVIEHAMQGDYKDAVLWVPEKGTGSCGSGDPQYEERLEGARLHLNSRQDPTFWTDVVLTRMLDELAMHDTAGLLADPFYLDVLARHAAILGRRLDVKSFIGLTRALTTSAHREALAKVYSRPVLQIFGAREAGTLFVEGEDGLLHHARAGSHVELLPAKVATPGSENLAMVVVTTLDREVMPLVRYVLGDLVQVHEGTTLRSVEGKLDDAIVRPDHAIVTPGAIDRALSKLGLRGYLVAQTGPSHVEVEVVSGTPSHVVEALTPLLTGMKIEARAAAAVAAEPKGKYRTTRRHGVPLRMDEAFA